MNEIDIALLCKSMGDSNRLKIVKMLSNGEKCACKILEEFEISQPTLSHHMRILCESGLVIVRREGKWSHYSLNRKIVLGLKAFFEGIGVSDNYDDDIGEL